MNHICSTSNEQDFSYTDDDNKSTKNSDENVRFYVWKHVL